MNLPSGLNIVLPESLSGSAFKNTPVSNILDPVLLLHHDIVKLRPEFRAVHIVQNLFPQTLCSKIISDAEKYAANNNGWSRNRHIGYPTTDIPLDDIYGQFSSIHGLLTGEVLPLIADKYQLKGQLRLGQVRKKVHVPSKQPPCSENI